MGGLTKQLATIPIDTGVDQYTDKRLAVDLLEGENIQYLNRGAPQKRFGNQSLVTQSTAQLGGSGNSPLAPNWIAELNNQLVRVGQDECLTYSEAQHPSGQPGQWEYVGYAGNFAPTQDILTNASGLVRDYDSIVVGNYKVITWLEGAGISGTQHYSGSKWFIMIQDNETGAIISSPQLIRDTSSVNVQQRSPRLAVSNGVVVAIIYQPTSATTGVCYFTRADFNTPILSQTNAWPAATILTTGGAIPAGPYLAWDFIGLPNGFAWAVELSAGANRVRVVTYLPTMIGTVSVYTSTTAVTGWDAFSLAFDSVTNILWFTLGKGVGGSGYRLDGIRFSVGVNSIITEVTPFTNIQTVVTGSIINVRRLASVSYTANTLWLFVEIIPNEIQILAMLLASNFTNVSGSISTTPAAFIEGSSVSPNLSAIQNIRIASRPRIIDTLAYINIYHDSYVYTSSDPINTIVPQQSSIILCRTPRLVQGPLVPVAFSAPRRIFNVSIELYNSFDKSGVLSVLDNRSGFAHIQNFNTDLSLLETNDIIPKFNSESVIYSLTYTQNPLFTVAKGINQLIDGSNIFDGIRSYEPSFPYFPFALGLSSSAAGSIPAGTYQYVAVYAYLTPSGAVDRSAPSTVLTETYAIDTDATIELPTISLTRKNYNNSKILIELYRAPANSIEFRFLGSVENDPTTYRLFFTDTYTNAKIATNPLLYSLGELDNVNPPSGRMALFHQSRIFVAGTDDDTIWFSKDASDGVARFNEALTIPPFEGGRIVALGVMDDKLVVFKRRTIHYIYGRGPNANAQGDQYSEPIQLASGIGCISPRSIVVWSNGIFFQADQGLYLLKRDLQVVNLSKDIITELDDHTITAGTRIDALTEIRFALLNESNNTGSFIVYNWYLDVWSIHRVFDGFSNSFRGAQHATTWQGVYTWITPDGQAYQEDNTQYRDVYNGSGTWINQKVRTSWVKLAGLQGYQRIYRVGVLLERLSNAGVTIEIYTDFNETSPSQTVTFTDSDLSEMTLQHLVIHVKQQKCQAISVRVLDVSSSSGTGAGLKITGITVQYGVKGGIARVGQSQRG